MRMMTSIPCYPAGGCRNPVISLGTSTLRRVVCTRVTTMCKNTDGSRVVRRNEKDGIRRHRHQPGSKLKSSNRANEPIHGGLS